MQDVADIQSEAFVLAVATIHDFRPDRAAEWFRATEADALSSLFTSQRNRLAINRLGTVEVHSGGGWLDGWGMHWPDEMPTEEIGLIVDEFGRLGGWSFEELHAILHGVPCLCPAFEVRSATQ